MKKIHFLGIGGIGMSALARWAIFNDYMVSGYDRERSSITDQLESEGVNIFFNRNYIYNITLKDFSDFIVYSSAFKDNHPILNFFKINNFKILKRSFFLSEITSSYKVIAIAGTHGKTTISCMLSHILKNSGFDCNAFIGGVSKNYNTNILIGSSKLMVVEADEYDRSFLSLSPFIGLISSIDKDHGDTYQTYDDMVFAYTTFAKKCKNIIIHNNLKKTFRKNKINNTISYSYLGGKIEGYTLLAHYNFDNSLINLQIKKDNQFLFDLDIDLIPKYNIENLLAAISIAIELNINYENIIDAIKSFKGVFRRFEYHIKTNNLILIEDYAHHPIELKSLIDDTMFLYPKKEITLVFQPHLFSRTKDFLDEFAMVLSKVDRLILLDIYAARESPITNFGIQDLLSRVTLNNKILLEKKDVCKYLIQSDCELIIIAGAGDISNLVPDLKSQLL